jgi:hypothetical protein
MLEERRVQAMLGGDGLNLGVLGMRQLGDGRQVPCGADERRRRADLVGGSIRRVVPQQQFGLVGLVEANKPRAMPVDRPGRSRLSGGQVDGHLRLARLEPETHRQRHFAPGGLIERHLPGEAFRPLVAVRGLVRA